MTYKFKAGDRVKLKCDPVDEDEDEGEFIGYTDRYNDYARIKWKDHGFWDHPVEHLYLAESNDKEQVAVMLLLNLGYTVSKTRQ